MAVLPDFQGRAIRLPDERLVHILEHPEMVGQEERIAETLLEPHLITLDRADLTVHRYHRFYETTPLKQKYLVVVVKMLADDAFVITAFFTNKERGGVRLWPL